MVPSKNHILLDFLEDESLCNATIFERDLHMDPESIFDRGDNSFLEEEEKWRRRRFFLSCYYC
jgi:hypothetical protein